MPFIGGELVLDDDGYGGDINRWLDDLRALKAQDMDALLWASGDVGSGKSTIMRQVLHAVDPTFDLSRIHFTQDDYMDGIATTHKGGALLWDEARLNRRAAMHGDRLEIMDSMQDVRGLLLIHGWCFPYDEWMDDALEEHRIDWRLHCFRKGMFNLQRPISGKNRGRPWHDWETIDTFRFGPNSGSENRAYLAKKEAHMRSRFKVRGRGQQAALGLDVERALALVDEIKDLGLDQS